jgi:hypothetical protein
MDGITLLKKYPLTTQVIKDWFMKSMIESFKDESVPEEFKQFMLEQGIEDDKVAKIIDVNVRILFDVFDENDIIIIIGYHENFGFNYAVCEDDDQQQYFKNRKEAEHAAIKVAFEILNDQLAPAVQEIEVTGEEIVEEN